MSRSWREQVRISLAPHQVALVRLARGMRGGVADRKVLAVESGAAAGSIGTGLIETGLIETGLIETGLIETASISDANMDTSAVGNGQSSHASGQNGIGANGSNWTGSNWTGSNWTGAIEALREMLAHPNVGRAGFRRIDASVVLSNHLVRYLVLPWSAELVTPAEEAEFARMRFVQVYGEAANRWQVSLAPAAAGAGRVAAAIDQELLDTLGQTLSGSPLRLRSIQPALMSQFNAWRRQIGDDAWLVLAERGRVLIAWIQNGEWRSVRARPIAGTAVPLAQWLTQERLLLDAPAPSKVCLSVVDDVAVDTEGVRVQSLSPRARNGFVPRADAGLLLAMAGAA